MKFSTIFVAILASFVTADESIKLYVNSKADAPQIFGAGISSKHSGAGINYLFLGRGAETLQYDGFEITSTNSGTKQWLNLDGPFVQLTVASTGGQRLTWKDVDGKKYLSVNGRSDGFFACKNTGDPYNYSANEYELMYYPSGGQPSSCLKIDGLYRA
ncbi:unnamed protein product [Ambrosiozyma monospora]|uniref:Unnamed protein product n=1 Tax=Ambrosiozyma monospora TaxID=43982 RepID=A0A9W6TAL3_AMBMO|nr:unnamed protein product [Ambrosiozyma monospora]